MARVLIVDDHPAVREALTLRIAAQPGWEVCGEAADVAEALRVAAATSPDVAVIDIGLKGGSGLDLIRRLRDRDDHVRMIVWSMFSEELYAERALRAGAVGYLTKDQATGTILDAIRQVLDGKLYLSEAMTQRLLRRSVRGEGQGGDPEVAALSDRELEVFRLIGLGRKNQDIAAELHLSVKTVETYRDRIREKLALADGAALARRALQWALENG
jgi:DNA-binding NarL/FixJ family response regulator